MNICPGNISGLAKSGQIVPFPGMKTHSRPVPGRDGIPFQPYKLLIYHRSRLKSIYDPADVITRRIFEYLFSFLKGLILIFGIFKVSSLSVEGIDIIMKKVKWEIR